MFENLPPLRRSNHDSDSPRRRALNALGSVLGTLPAPWRVLRDASFTGESAGLGARFVALHPDLGIALVDLAPARPKAALAPLRSLLTRGNRSVFTMREPPIASVLLSRDEIPVAAERVEAALAELGPSGMASSAWPEIAIALIVSAHPEMMAMDGGRRVLAAPSTPPAEKPAAPPEPPPAAPRRQAAPPRPPQADARAAAPPEPKPEAAREARPNTGETRDRENAAASERGQTVPPPPRFRTNVPPIDVPRIDPPALDPHRGDVSRIAMPPAASAPPSTRRDPEISSAPPVRSETPPARPAAPPDIEAAPPRAGIEPPRLELEEEIESDQLQRRRRMGGARGAEPRPSFSRSPSIDLPHAEMPRFEGNGRAAPRFGRDPARPGEAQLGLPPFEVPQPPAPPRPERGAPQMRAGEPRFAAPQSDRGDAFERAEPALRRESSGGAEPPPPRLRLVAERDPLAPRPAGERKRRRPALWIVGGTLSVIVASVLAFPNQTVEPSAQRGGIERTPPAPVPSTTSAQPAIDSTPMAPAPRQASNAPGRTPPSETEATPIAPPQRADAIPIAPPRAATVLPPLPEKSDLERSVAAARPAPPPAKPAPPTQDVAAAPKPAAHAPREAAAKAKPATHATREAAVAPKPAAAAGTAQRAAKPGKLARHETHDVAREAEAQIVAKPAPNRATPATNGPIRLFPAPAQPTRSPDVAGIGSRDTADDPTVTVDGTAYVAGREPHFLGSLSSPAELASAPAPTAAADNQPGPSSPPDKPQGSPLPPSTDFAITPSGIMAPSGVVTPFGTR